MRSWTHADRLAVILVALAGINVGILDQVGHGLIADVEAKYSELGTDWMVLRHTYTAQGKAIDFLAIMDEVKRLPSVKEAMWAISSDQYIPAPSPTDTGFGLRRSTTQEILLLGPDYDPQRHPYLYVLFGDASANTTFYRTELLWSRGKAPVEPGDIAVPLRFAAERGLDVGDGLVIPWDRGFLGPGNGTERSFRITGLFEPIPTGNVGEDTDRLLAVPPDDLLTVASRAGVMPNRILLFLRSELPRMAETAAAIERILTDHGLALGVQEDVVMVISSGGGWRGSVIIHSVDPSSGQGDGEADTTTRPSPSVTPAPSEGPEHNEGGAPPDTVISTWDFGMPFGGDGQGRPDVDLFANVELLEAAFSAAERAGLWFRLLGVGSLLLAAIGIGFIVRANARRLTLDIAIRQAAGFTADRLLVGWMVHALGVTFIGSLVALAVVVLAALLGLGPRILGVALITDLTTWILVPVITALLYLVAGMPMVIRLARRPPAVNLREVDPR